ncbi:hypothetical protein TNCV_317521 [Trichonephila clavipes]|nr:hypothetical protein TNCV_317521 [Trichonephila clavipes]
MSAGTGEYFPPLQIHAEIVEVEIGGVAIYRPFGEFRRAKSYGHLYGAQGQRQALAISELPSDVDSAASKNSDVDDEDYIQNFAQGENILSSDDKEINEIQQPSSTFHIPVKTEGGLCRRCTLCITRKDVHCS